MGTITTNFKRNNLNLGTYFANSGNIYNSSQTTNFKQNGIDIGNYLIPISVGTKVSVYPTGDKSYYKLSNGQDLAEIYKIRKYTCMRELSYSVISGNASLNVTLRSPGVFDTFQVGAGGNGGAGSSNWGNDGGGGGGGGGARLIALGVISNSTIATLFCGNVPGGNSIITSGSITITAEGGRNGGNVGNGGGNGGAGGNISSNGILSGNIIGNTGGNGGKGGFCPINNTQYSIPGTSLPNSNIGYTYNNESIYFSNMVGGGTNNNQNNSGGGGGASHGRGGSGRGPTATGEDGIPYGGGGGGGGGQWSLWAGGQTFSGGKGAIGICQIYINNPNTSSE